MLKRLFVSLLLVLGLAAQPAMAQGGGGGPVGDTFSSNELVETGGAFFGSVAQGLASLVERAVGQLGLPNGYILGEEGSGALFVGARFGQGQLFTRNAGQHQIYWQGPTFGLDAGGEGSKVMILVYNLDAVQQIFGRYPGVDGSAYAVAGLGMTFVKSGDVIMVPIRSGLGLRAGINVGYLKFTQEPTWNPF